MFYARASGTRCVVLLTMDHFLAFLVSKAWSHYVHFGPFLCNFR